LYLVTKWDKIKQSKLIKGEMGKTNIARQRGLVDDGIRLEENAIMQSRHTKGREGDDAIVTTLPFWSGSPFVVSFLTDQLQFVFLFLFLFLSAECNL
jgi:hypothetical protein